MTDQNEMAGQYCDSTVVWPHLKTTVISAIQHIPLYKGKAYLNQKYVVEGLSIAQIAALCFASKEAVRTSLLKLKIPLREPSKPHGRSAQPRYGEKVVKDLVVSHQAEQRAIDAILEMSAQGLSLRQIAKVLNQMKVPTKCRGKSWHPEMVKRIIAHKSFNERIGLPQNTPRRAKVGPLK